MRRRNRFERMLVLVLLGFTLIVLAGGRWSYVRQKRLLEEAAEVKLNAVADLKTGLLDRWRHERLDDANLFRGNPFVISAVKHFIAEPTDSAVSELLLGWMGNLKTYAHCSKIALLDAQQQPRLSLPAAQQWILPRDTAWAESVFRSNRVALDDLRFGVSNSIGMKLYVPLADGQSHRPIGGLLIEYDPNEFLFPQIQLWPTPSRTAETLLVRRDGGDVVYLNTLRHQSNTALRLRYKVAEKPDMPASKAVLGETGTVRGEDYRNIPVLAAARSIPDSPWFIVAKQDILEIQAPVRQRAWVITLGSILLIGAAGQAVILIWRIRETQFVRQELTTRKKSEAALQQSYSQLERLTAEVERKNEELENLIYAASHDLRSPLVNIEGFGRRLEKTCRELSVILEKPGDAAEACRQSAEIARAQIPKSLNYIRAGVAKMNALIAGLLHLSRLGQIPIKPQLLDMNQMMQQLIRAMAYQIEKAGAVVQCDPLPACYGDPLLINQVFSNLLDNALKYRDASRPLVIRISGRTENGQRIYCVADNGIGIAPAAQSKIWELFHRLDPAKSEGEGLGLNLVRRILDRHDGRVWVESNAGEGSRFHISLPETPVQPVQAASTQNQTTE